MAETIVSEPREAASRSGTIDLSIRLPTKLLFEGKVRQISARGPQGSFSILPRHADFVGTLVAGVIVVTGTDNAETDDAEADGAGTQDTELFFGADEGVLTKRGASVHICVHSAFQASSLAEVRDRIAQVFAEMDDRDRAARNALTRLEANVVRRFSDMLGTGS